VYITDSKDFRENFQPNHFFKVASLTFDAIYWFTIYNLAPFAIDYIIFTLFLKFLFIQTSSTYFVILKSLINTLSTGSLIYYHNLRQMCLFGFRIHASISLAIFSILLSIYLSCPDEFSNFISFSHYNFGFHLSIIFHSIVITVLFLLTFHYILF
jgi:hypothetical protein